MSSPSVCPSTDPGKLGEEWLASVGEAPGPGGKNMGLLAEKSFELIDFLRDRNTERKKWGKENNNFLVINTAEERLKYLETCEKNLNDALDSQSTYAHVINACMDIH